MKWFWYSLIGFCLLMCSCKSKKSACLINEVSNENVNTEWIRYQALKDSSWIHKFEIDKSKLKIVETLTIIEYDKESGKPVKETNAKRETSQDTDKVASEEGKNRVESHSQDSLNHFADVSKMVESETKTETKDSTESFWKWLGIMLGLLIGVTIFVRSRK